MTWVVGGKHLFCARALSDVQVTITYPNGNKYYFDAVKKVHEIGPGLTILFADSIKLAFAIIEDLKVNFYRTIDPRTFKAPEEIMRRLVKYIKFYFNKHQNHGKERVEFLVFITPLGTYTEFGMWKVTSPHFQLIERDKPFSMLELGSGSVLEDYRKIVERNSKGVYIIDDPEGGLPTAVIPTGKVALEYIFAEALEFKNAGISLPMHITGITHEGVFIKELAETPTGKFPLVANSWQELIKILGGKGISLAGSLASA
ncbi:hypothetical protein [Pseudomonas viridiflava]|uniref:hypothetical protein n=1 Tax=Pseudomonas viridiflava TaxID=33069 RepID=UPI000F02EFF7|nr:hypothetical protein [Pseudomonas viridiflava]MEE4077744.1 hypothetical protein [Pseudomonas viridiflava]VVN38800.1 hypothetical protein PS634_05278 [Pseudomonas fluorescens]